MSVETLTSFRFVPKGKIHFGIPFRVKRKSKKSKNPKNQNKAKKYQKLFDRAALWRVYVYLISSTSMQNENPFWNSVRQIKIRCAKYKFAERSHNFLMQLPTSSSLVSVETLTSFRFVPKENPFWNSIPCEKEIQKIQKIKNIAKKYQKMVWPSHPLERICLLD